MLVFIVVVVVGRGRGGGGGFIGVVDVPQSLFCSCCSFCWW